MIVEITIPRIRPSRIQFGIRTLFFVTAISCAVFALLVVPIHRQWTQDEIISAIQAHNAEVHVEENGIALTLGHLGKVGDDDFEKICTLVRRLPRLHRICFLDYYGNINVTDRSLVHLKQFGELSDLLLPGNITDAGLDHITGLNELELLSLTGCSHITDSGIAKLTQLPHLDQLWLVGTNVSSNAIPHLARMNGLWELRLGSQLSADDVRQLQEKLPNTGILTSPIQAAVSR